MSFFFQMAESKMVMHQEMITKDEEIGKLRTNLKKASEESSKLNEEIEALKKAQVRFWDFLRQEYFWTKYDGIFCPKLP